MCLSFLNKSINTPKSMFKDMDPRMSPQARVQGEIS